LRDVTRKFLDLFFNPNETVCVSDCSGGYHSVDQASLSGNIVLESPKETVKDRIIKETDINLVAINPISGWRRDENVTSFRTFMIECDDMSIKNQMSYVNRVGFPYSYCCFSGGKSLHFALVLDHEIPSYHMYRHTYEWILNILDQADQKTKNPSRSVRFPNVIRKFSGQEQQLIYMGNRIPLEELSKWLNKYPSKKPRPLIRKERNTGTAQVSNLKEWAKKALKEGVHNMEGSRNQTWMALGCEMALNGFSLEATLSHLENYFEEQGDFTQREWVTTIKSGWSYADKITT
jgi:hypothetical protein